MRAVTMPNLGDFFFRVLPAAAGALLGSVLTLCAFLLLKIATISEEVTLEENAAPDEPLAFSKFMLFVILFLSSLFANMLATTFSVFANRHEFHGNLREVLLNIFAIVLVLFAVCAPFFLIFPIEIAFKLAKFFLPFTALTSSLLFYLFANPQWPILAAYQVSMSGLIVSAVFAVFFPYIIPNELMVFFALPLAWLLIPLVSFFVQMAFAGVDRLRSSGTRTI